MRCCHENQVWLYLSQISYPKLSSFPYESLIVVVFTFLESTAGFGYMMIFNKAYGLFLLKFIVIVKWSL